MYASYFIDDFLWIRNMHKDADEVLIHVDEGNFACGLACSMDRVRKNSSEKGHTFIDHINALLNECNTRDNLL